MATADQSSPIPLSYRSPVVRKPFVFTWAGVGVLVFSLLTMGLATFVPILLNTRKPWKLWGSWGAIAAVIFATARWSRRRAMADRKADWRSLMPISYGMSVVAVIFCLIVGALSTVVASHMTPYRWYLCCWDNMRQIGIGLNAYAAANGGQFPDSLADLLASNYVSAGNLVCCCAGDTPAPGSPAAPAAQAALIRVGKHCSYIYYGKGMSTSSNPDMIVVAERLENHEGVEILCVYAGGQPGCLHGDAAAHTLRELAAGHNPPWDVLKDSPTTRPGG